MRADSLRSKVVNRSSQRSQTRRRRIENRPPWRGRDIDEQTRFGQWLRANIGDRVDTDQLSLERSADAVAQWVTDRLGC